MYLYFLSYLICFWECGRLLSEDAALHRPLQHHAVAELRVPAYTYVRTYMCVYLSVSLSLYIYMYIYIYIYIIETHKHICVYIYIYIHRYTHIHRTHPGFFSRKKSTQSKKPASGIINANHNKLTISNDASNNTMVQILL